MNVGNKQFLVTFTYMVSAAILDGSVKSLNNRRCAQNILLNDFIFLDVSQCTFSVIMSPVLAFGYVVFRVAALVVGLHLRCVVSCSE